MHSRGAVFGATAFPRYKRVQPDHSHRRDVRVRIIHSSSPFTIPFYSCPSKDVPLTQRHLPPFLFQILVFHRSICLIRESKRLNSSTRISTLTVENGTSSSQSRSIPGSTIPMNSPERSTLPIAPCRRSSSMLLFPRNARSLTKQKKVGPAKL